MEHKLSHHSTVDWDFRNRFWELDLAKFVSPPSSIHGTSGTKCPLNCKHPSVLCLPEVQIVTYAWTHAYTLFINCRNQVTVGNASVSNCYSFGFTEIETTLYRNVNGIGSYIGEFPYILPLDTWKKLRLTCFNGYNLLNQYSACFTLEVYEHPDWIQKGDILYDSLNKWKDSDINRVGLTVDQSRNFDDTEIWKP